MVANNQSIQHILFARRQRIDRQFLLFTCPASVIYIFFKLLLDLNVRT